jgi:uncharacterized membrane protein
VVVLTILVVSWIGLNCVSLAVGNKPIDPPPFFWMQGAVALAALYMTVFILATQRREDELANRHEQLTLELAMLSEQKAAKIIALLDELRLDHPEIQDRVDKGGSRDVVPSRLPINTRSSKTSHENVDFRWNTTRAPRSRSRRALKPAGRDSVTNGRRLVVDSTRCKGRPLTRGRQSTTQSAA